MVVNSTKCNLPQEKKKGKEKRVLLLESEPCIENLFLP